MAKFKLLTLLGIRPDYIRMYKVIRLLDSHGGSLEHILVHSGQHYDPELFGNFLKEFNIRQPDFDLGIGLTLKERGASNHVSQVALLNERLFDLLEKIEPDAVMYLGDTNTVLSSVTVTRCGIPVVHLEAGGRSFDWRMPEEKNRIIIDHLSDALYCYFPQFRDILLSEGIDEFRINVIGNIIVDAVSDFGARADESRILHELGVEEKKFILVTLHREENIVEREILGRKILDILRFAKEQKLPVVWPVMPRTQAMVKKFNLGYLLNDPLIIKTKPLGFFDFLKLEKTARIAVSDSGTVQEETLLVGTPCVVARRSTERPRAIFDRANILEGFGGKDTLYNTMLKALKMKTTWDRNVMNPDGVSPSEKVYKDLIAKIESGYFKTSRDFAAIKNNPFARKAYHVK